MAASAEVAPQLNACKRRHRAMHHRVLTLVQATPDRVQPVFVGNRTRSHLRQEALERPPIRTNVKSLTHVIVLDA
jgi:hypothetical protein